MDSTKTDMVAERLHCHPTPISSGRLHPHKMSNPGAYPLKVWPHHFFFFCSGLNTSNIQLFSDQCHWCDVTLLVLVWVSDFSLSKASTASPHTVEKKGGENTYMGQNMIRWTVIFNHCQSSVNQNNMGHYYYKWYVRCHRHACVYTKFLVFSPPTYYIKLVIESSLIFIAKWGQVISLVICVNKQL